MRAHGCRCRRGAASRTASRRHHAPGCDFEECSVRRRRTCRPVGAVATRGSRAARRPENVRHRAPACDRLHCSPKAQSTEVGAVSAPQRDPIRPRFDFRQGVGSRSRSATAIPPVRAPEWRENWYGTSACCGHTILDQQAAIAASAGCPARAASSDCGSRRRRRLSTASRNRSEHWRRAPPQGLQPRPANNRSATARTGSASSAAGAIRQASEAGRRQVPPRPLMDIDRYRRKRHHAARSAGFRRGADHTEPDQGVGHDQYRAARRGRVSLDERTAA